MIMDFANANTERNGISTDHSGLIRLYQNHQLDSVSPAITKNANQTTELELITIQEHTPSTGITEPLLNITTLVLD
jgi:hypothetical protein